MKRSKLSVAGWRRQLFDHLGMSTLGEEALRLADGMALQAAREMRVKRSKWGRDDFEARLKELAKL